MMPSSLYRHEASVVGGTLAYSKITSGGKLGAVAMMAGTDLATDSGHVDRYGYTYFLPSSNLGLPELKAEEESAVSSVSKQIAFIQVNLSFNISELSKVLEVQRPTIYSWANGSSTPSASNQERINTVYGLAKLWKEKTQRPIGEQRKLPLKYGLSVTDLLMESEIDKRGISAMFDRLGKNVSPQSSRKTFSVRKLARQYGFKERSKQQKRNAFYLAAGKK